MANVLFDALFAPHICSEKTFLILPDESEITYADFLSMASRFANTIRTAGVKIGDRVVVQAEKSPQTLALYAACVQSGAIFLPLNTAYTASEVDYFVDDAQASLLICDGSSMEALTPVAARSNCQIMTLNGDGTGSFKDAASNESTDFTPVKREPDDLAAFLYTSGSSTRTACLSLPTLCYWREAR